MPRLTDDQYLYLHRSLRTLWLHDHAVFRVVSQLDQRRVHDYFRPDERLSEKDLLEHRQRITEKYPSLPQQAGRALARIHEDAAVLAVYQTRLAREPQPVKVKPQRTKPVPYGTRRNLIVRPVIKPNVDMRGLARTLLSLAQDPEFIARWNDPNFEDTLRKERDEKRRPLKRPPPDKQQGSG
jgi:hypothetical protein